MREAADPDALALYEHVFVPAAGSGAAPLLVLPRTGGTEHDLVPFAQRLAPGAPILSLRGNVIEEGRPRFFRRHGAGDFDIEDLARRTVDLGRFVRAACSHYRLAPPVALGHSNGANIRWSLMLSGADVLAGAMLLRPMLAYRPEATADLRGFPVLVVAGDADRIVAPGRANDLPAVLTSAGAFVTLTWVSGGHDLTDQDESAARNWLAGSNVGDGAAVRARCA